MRYSSVSRFASASRWVPTLAAAVLLVACGTANNPGPAATMTTPAPSPTAAVTTTGNPAPTPTAGMPRSGAAVPSTSTISDATTPAKAIAAWMRKQGYSYVGSCEFTDLETDIGKWCSTLYKTRGTHRIDKVGLAFSEYTIWLLLDQSEYSWRVIDTAKVMGSAPPPW